ncbi:MAG: hypothetical protein L6R42_001123 [Xanthoria sp. 1 TBL-2021]|nr:MAG: hypothetical protein L6R42_001123 [Xanthoria sp. 1 TBL-2021]
MPKAKALATKDDNARVSPYSKSKPSKGSTSKSNTDKENADANPFPNLNSPKPLPKSKLNTATFATSHSMKSTAKSLATATRLSSNIPGTNKKWTQAGMSKEMEELESRMGAVECHRNSTGPSPRSLGTFLKKKGKMGGGDSPAYY